MQRTGLVLSAGAMFGSYQAGVWAALAGEFAPDVVVGASIGAVNGWAIAGGCPSEELLERWLAWPVERVRPRLRWGAVLPPEPFYRVLREMHARYRPRLDFGVVITALARLRPVLVRTPDAGWEHLAASCAVPGAFPPVRIGGRLYVDGGLAGHLPVWAAVEMGCTRILAVDCLPDSVRRVSRGVARATGFQPRVPPRVVVSVIEPRRPLGGVREGAAWERERAETWIRLGRRDAAEWLAARDPRQWG